MTEEKDQITPINNNEDNENDKPADGVPTVESKSDPVSKPQSTETVTTGEYSEEIKVVRLEDLHEKKEESWEDEIKIYESSLQDISEEQRVMGKVIAIHENEILMDIGFKSEGIIPRDEFEDGELPKVGDQIEVYVDCFEDENGQMILSKRKADFLRIWERVKEVFSHGETVEGQITRRIKGGMVVDIMGIDAFLPGSQIDIRPVIDFDYYVGQTYEFRIVKLNELRKNIVLSRKELLEESMKEKREDLLSRIKVGDILQGRVKNITDFGVFIDLGGLDGLLHITDISWGRINHPKEMISMDQDLTVKVIDYDPERRRVSLGLKQLTPHPWEGIEGKYPVGSVVSGKIVNITNYGVFVEIEKGIEGLIHISEVSWTQHIKHPSEVFSLNEEVKAKVLSVDVEGRKLSLGYKQLEPDPWEYIEQTYKVGSVHKGVVRNLTQFGVFVELQEGIDGFIHISNLSWMRKIRHPREILNRDDEIEVKVLEVSRENRRISLGYKQLTEDPWLTIEETFTAGSIVEGKIEKIDEKAIIVTLDHDIDGIIPIGELPKIDRKNVAKRISIGDKLELKVLEVNRNERRIILSRTQLITKKPKTKVKAYMKKQKVSSEKIEIPKEVVEKIKESEKPSKIKSKVKTKTGAAEEEGKKRPKAGKKEKETSKRKSKPKEKEKKTKKTTSVKKPAKEETKERPKPGKTVAKKSVVKRTKVSSKNYSTDESQELKKGSVRKRKAGASKPKEKKIEKDKGEKAKPISKKSTKSGKK